MAGPFGSTRRGRRTPDGLALPGFRARRSHQMKRILLAAAIFAAAFFFVAATTAEDDDLVFVNGLVADGTGAPLFAADVAVRGDRIAAVGPLTAERKARARRRVDATRSRRLPGVHRPPRSIGVRRPRRPSGGLEDHAGDHDRGDRRRGVDRAAQRRDAEGRRRAVRLLRRPPRLHDAGGLLRAVPPEPARDQPRHLRRTGRPQEVRRRDRGPARHPGRARRDGAGSRDGDEGGRARRLHVAPVRPRHVQLDRGDRRDGEGRRALRRRLLHPPAVGGESDRLLARRGLPDRARGEDPRERLAPEDRLEAELGEDAARPRAARGGPRRGARRRREHVPLDRRLERPRRLPPSLGARGRKGKARRATRRPGGPRAREEGDGRGQRRLVEPVGRLRRRRRRDALVRPESRAQEVRGEDARGDRPGVGNRPARRRDGPRRRRQGELLLHHLHDERRRRPRGAPEPPRRLLHRLQRFGDRRHPLEGEVTPARVGVGGADPGHLRPRREAPPARGGDSQDDLAPGGPRPDPGPRPLEARAEGRHRRLLSEGRPGGCDVRGSAPLLRGDPVCRRQRPARRRQRDDHVRAAGTARPRPRRPEEERDHEETETDRTRTGRRRVVAGVAGAGESRGSRRRRTPGSSEERSTSGAPPSAPRR